MYWSFKELELPDSWITAFCLSCFIASRLKKWRLWLWPKSFTKLRSTNLHCYSRQSLQFKKTCRGESLCRVLVMHFEQLFTFLCEMVFFCLFVLRSINIYTNQPLTGESLQCSWNWCEQGKWANLMARWVRAPPKLGCSQDAAVRLTDDGLMAGRSEEPNCRKPECHLRIQNALQHGEYRAGQRWCKMLKNIQVSVTTGPWNNRRWHSLVIRFFVA